MSDGNKQPEVKQPEIKQPDVVIQPAPREMDTSKLKGTSLTNQESVPSNWEIKPKGQGIIATNMYTGKVFEGTQKEFSKMLRGG